MGSIKSTIPTRIYLIALFFIFLSPAVLFIEAVLDGKSVKGLTFFYGESKDVLQFVLIEGGLLFLSIVLKRLFCGGIWCALILRFIPLGVAVYILRPYLIEGLFDPSEDWFIWSCILLIVSASFFTLDVWFPWGEDLWNRVKRWWFRLIVYKNEGVWPDDNKTSSIDGKRIYQKPNYPIFVSATAILSRTIFFNHVTLFFTSILIVCALFGVYYSFGTANVTFSGPQMMSLLSGVASAPILKVIMPKINGMLFGKITNDIKGAIKHTAIVGTGPLAMSFIREDVRNLQSKDESNKAFVLYAARDELTPDLIELCQERFIGICQPTQFDSRWVNDIEFRNLERIFIGTGSDLINIERLGFFVEAFNEFEEIHQQKRNIKITIEIEDRDLIPFLDEAFSEWADTDDTECGSQFSKLLSLQYISYGELAAHDYFQTAEPNYLKKATKASKDGLTNYLNDLDAASIVLIGTGKLAREFVYFLAKVWHLPTKRNAKNASPKIILMGNDETDGQPISDFRDEICQIFPGISDYFEIEIVLLDFFKDQMDSSDYEEVWSDDKLKRIFLLDDDTYRNVELVNVFTNKTYLDDMVLTCSDGSSREIFIANKSYKKLHDAMSISSDKKAASKLHHVNSIGLISDVSKDRFIFDDLSAKITDNIKKLNEVPAPEVPHVGRGLSLQLIDFFKALFSVITNDDKKGSNQDLVNEDENSSEALHDDLTRRRSAKSLAQHLHVKLLIFGLEYREQKEKSTSRGGEDKENRHREVLKEKNKKSFYEALVSYCEDRDRWVVCGNHEKVVEDLKCLLKLKDCKPMSPEELDQKIVEINDECEGHDNPIASLINCEHDRWLCYHQINNWKLFEQDDDEPPTPDNYLTKESPLLKSLDALEGELKKKAIVRAFNQYLCIPEILAEADCEIHEVVGSKESEDVEGH